MKHMNAKIAQIWDNTKHLMQQQQYKNASWNKTYPFVLSVLLSHVVLLVPLILFVLLSLCALLIPVDLSIPDTLVVHVLLFVPLALSVPYVLYVHGIHADPLLHAILLGLYK